MRASAQYAFTQISVHITTVKSTKNLCIELLQMWKILLPGLKRLKNATVCAILLCGEIGSTSKSLLPDKNPGKL